MQPCRPPTPRTSARQAARPARPAPAAQLPAAGLAPRRPLHLLRAGRVLRLVWVLPPLRRLLAGRLRWLAVSLQWAKPLLGVLGLRRAVVLRWWAAVLRWWAAVLWRAAKLPLLRRTMRRLLVLPLHALVGASAASAAAHVRLLLRVLALRRRQRAALHACCLLPWRRVLLHARRLLWAARHAACAIGGATSASEQRPQPCTTGWPLRLLLVLRLLVVLLLVLLPLLRGC